MKVNRTIAQIISMPNVHRFSIGEIRTAYLMLMNDTSLNPNDVRHLIYRELMKLVKIDWVRKTVSKKKGLISFVKTDLFDIHSIIFIDNDFGNEQKNNDHFFKIKEKGLEEKLRRYKHELLIGLGEVDEYKQLVSEFPELQTKLQPQYNNTSENNSRLLGKIKAIETLIRENNLYSNHDKTKNLAS